MKTVAILGSTGTIGRNALDVIRRLPCEFKVAALAAGANSRLLEDQAREFRPRIVSLGRPEDAASFRRDVRIPGLKVLAGPEGAEEIGGDPGSGFVVSAITGIAGLRPTLAAVRAGKTIALANKESMVVAGPFLRREAARSGAVLIPVDSEHSGVFQCLAGLPRAHVRKVIGPIATPDVIQFADGLPKTRSGKIMRRILVKIAAGNTDMGDTSTLADPAVVQTLIAGKKK